MRTYTTTATRTLPLVVTYTCRYCGKQNVDDTEALKISGSASSTGYASPDNESKAVENLNRHMASLIAGLQKGQYGKAKLACRCIYCDRRQPWSSFIEDNKGAYFGLFVVGAIAAFMGINPSFHSSWMVSVTALAMMLPGIVMFVKNKLQAARVRGLKPEEKPSIALRLPAPTPVPAPVSASTPVSNWLSGQDK